VESGANALMPPLSAPRRLAELVVEQRRRRWESPWTSDAYGDGHAAERIAEAVGTLLD
jgi:hypothetical protein